MSMPPPASVPPPPVPPSSPYGGPQQPYYPPQQPPQQYQQQDYQQQQAPPPGGYPGYGTQVGGYQPGYQQTGSYQPAPGYPPQPYYPDQWAFALPPAKVHSAPTPLQLIPIHHWFKDRSLRNWITILFVFLVLTPTVALYVQGAYPDLTTQTAWAFAIYFAGLWLVILWVTVRPPMVRPWMLAEIAVIGLVLETPMAVWMEEKLNTGSNGIFSMIFTVGFPEEIVKALPVLVLAFVHREQWAALLPKDYLFIGAVSGLAFGASEAVLYTTQAMPADAGAFAQQGASPAQIAFQAIFEGAWRLLTDPISHAIWAGIAGYFIGLAIRYSRGRVVVGATGLILVAVLHGINDRLAENGDWGWIIEVGVSVLLFIGYVQAGGVVEHELEEVPIGAGGVPQAGAPGPVQVPGQPQIGFEQWSPGLGATGSGYPGAAPMPAYVPPAFNPAGGWGSTGFTQIQSVRRPTLSASQSLAMSQSQNLGQSQVQGQTGYQPQVQQQPPQQHGQAPQQAAQGQAGPTQYQIPQQAPQYPGQYPQPPQNPPQGPPQSPPNPQDRRTY